MPDFDLEKAKQILEDAGYKDTDGDGVREMPGGGQPLNFKYMVRSDSINARPIAEFFTGWLDEIGIATTEKVTDDSQLTTIIGKGDYDIFAWGWTPFVDPDPMLSYFTCDQIASDPDDPTDYYNDANYCDPEYDKLYEQQKVELDDDKRVEIVHEMLKRQAQWGVYNTLYTEPDTQAYVNDRFTGWVKQPAETGPVLYSNTSPTYARLKPVSASASGGDDGGGGSGGIIAIVVAALLALADRRVRDHAAPQRRRTGVSARFVTGKVLASLATLIFVICFNFFLFRVVESDPVANLYRGRNLSASQRAELTKQFGLDKSTGAQFVSYLKQTATLNFGRSYTNNQPVWDEIKRKAGPTIALVGISAVLSGVFGILLGIAAAWRRRTKTDYSVTGFSIATYSMPDFWLGMLLLTTLAVGLGLFPVGGLVDPASTATGFAKLADQAQHMFLPALTLTLAYLGEYAIVMRSSLLDTMREDYLVLARAKGLRDVLVRNRHAVPNALLPVVALLAINFGFVALGRDRGRGDLLLARPRTGQLRGAQGSRPADASGTVSRVQRRGDLLQLRR